MEKLFLSAALVFAAASVFGQGQIVFTNNPSQTITNPVTGLPALGSAANQNDTQVGLYIGNATDSVNAMVLVTATNCSSPGRFNGGTRTLPGWTGTVRLQVRCWLANTLYPSFEAAYAGSLSGDASVLLGVSDPITFALTVPPAAPASIANAGLTPIVVFPRRLGIYAPRIVGTESVILGTNAANGTRAVRLSANIDTGELATQARFQYGLGIPYAGTNGPIGLSIAHITTNLDLILPFSPGFTYHWNVVASNSLGSATSADQTFTVSPTPSGILGDVNGDGFVSQSELDLVYANYVTNSPWLAMTNVAGLGGTNMTFALPSAELGAYSVEYSTNLINWLLLGPATPRYDFTDTNASADPVRHYRLRYP